MSYVHSSSIYNEFKKIIRNNKLESIGLFKIPHLDKNNFRYSKRQVQVPY